MDSHVPSGPCEVVLIGCGGVANELLGYLERDPGYRVVAVLDDRAGEELHGHQVQELDSYRGDCRRALLAVGLPEWRASLAERCRDLDMELVSYIHPSAVVSPFASLGAGCFVGPFAVVAGDARLDDLVFLNAYCSVGHDARLGEASCLMPYAYVGGFASLGNQCYLATGGRVLPSARVGDRSRVSAGAVLHRDMPADQLAFGNPAKFKPDTALLKRREKADD